MHSDELESTMHEDPSSMTLDDLVNRMIMVNRLAVHAIYRADRGVESELNHRSQRLMTEFITRQQR